MKHYQTLLEQLQAQNQLRRLTSAPPCRLNLSGNDYLGLTQSSEWQVEFFERFSDRPLPALGSTSSRLLTGNSEHHEALEHTLQQAYGRPALLFNSGYHANIGILPALANRQTLILADKLVHASLIDGIRLSGAPYKRFRHNDTAQLAVLLEQHAAAYQHVIIVTESLFSMDGDFAPLSRLVQLKQQYANILLYLDEAHAVGVYGATGLGLAEQEACLNDIDILVGTFGKAAASQGAYAICNDILKNYLINTTRPLIFSTALPPLQAAWSDFIFQKFAGWSDKRRHLAHISARLRSAISQRHLPMPGQSHIVPYILGSNRAAEQAAEELQRQGCYSLPIRPPTVPPGTARLRFSLTAAMSETDIDWLISLLPELPDTQLTE